MIDFVDWLIRLICLTDFVDLTNLVVMIASMDLNCLIDMTDVIGSIV